MLLKYKDATCNRSEADDSIEIKPLPGGRWRLGMIAGSLSTRRIFVRRRGILSARSTGSPLGVILLPDSPSRSVVCKYLLVVYETQALLRAVVSKVLPSC